MDNSRLLDVVYDYYRQGLTPIPFETKSKGTPVWGSWRDYQEVAPTPKELQLLFEGLEAVNIALVGGVQSPHGYPFFVDCDDVATATGFANHLTGLGIDTWTVQRDRFEADDPHAGGQHFYFMADQPVKSGKCHFGEIRGQGSIIIAPYSIHPGGATYGFKQKPARLFRLDSLTAIPGLPLALADGHNRRRLPKLAWKLLQGDGPTVLTPLGDSRIGQ